jgi:hypothetical protein
MICTAHVYVHSYPQMAIPPWSIGTANWHMMQSLFLCIVTACVYTGGAGKTGVEKMMESMESGDSGGLPMVRPGDASKSLSLCSFSFFCFITRCA